MSTPVEVVFRNMDRARVVEERVAREMAKLERFHDRMIAAHVVVEAPHAKQNTCTMWRCA